MMIPFGGKMPQDCGAAFVAPNATVLGDVDLGHAATTDELAKLVASAGQCGGHTGAHCLFPPNLEAGASKTMRGVLVTRRGSRLPDVAMAVSAISVC